MKVRLFLTSLGLGLGLLLPSCKESEAPTTEPSAPVGQVEEELELFSETRPLMGTEFTIHVYAPNRLSAIKAIDNAFEIAADINQAASDYDENSELSKLNAAPHGEPIAISKLLGDLLFESLVIANITEGAYDPTLGPMTLLWRKSRRSKTLPSPEELAAAKAASGYQNLELSKDRLSVTKKVPNMRLDLGGIAKGFAAEQMYRVLEYYELPRSSVMAGGDLRVGDPPPGETQWPMAVRHRYGNEQNVDNFKQLAASTSGDLYQFVEIDGVRYSHLIDPRTGLGITKAVSVTVFAKTATLSDPLATALCILPEAEGQKVAKKFEKVQVLYSEAKDDSKKPSN